jgi:hypothetical protein
MMTSCRTLGRKSEPSYNHRLCTDSLTTCRYDFEYEDDDEEESGDVDIENKYYNAKQLKVDDPEAAIDEFLGMPALEEEKSEWYDRSVFGVHALPVDRFAGASRA